MDNIDQHISYLVQILITAILTGNYITILCLVGTYIASKLIMYIYDSKISGSSNAKYVYITVGSMLYEQIMEFLYIRSDYTETVCINRYSRKVKNFKYCIPDDSDIIYKGYRVSITRRDVENRRSYLKIKIPKNIYDTLTADLLKYMIDKRNKPKTITYTCDRIHRYSHNINKTYDNYCSRHKDTIWNLCTEFLSNKNKYHRLGLAYKISFLLQGRPGSGKTCLAYALSSYFKMDITKVSSTNLNSIPELRDIKNSIILFDEFDCIIDPRSYLSMIYSDKDHKSGKKSENNSTDHKRRLLYIMDSYDLFSGCILLYTTNHPDKIEDVYKRPGRIDHILDFGTVYKEDIRQLLELFGYITSGLKEKYELTMSEALSKVQTGDLEDFYSDSKI